MGTRIGKWHRAGLVSLVLGVLATLASPLAMGPARADEVMEPEHPSIVQRCGDFTVFRACASSRVRTQLIAGELGLSTGLTIDGSGFTDSPVSAGRATLTYSAWRECIVAACAHERPHVLEESRTCTYSSLSRCGVSFGHNFIQWVCRPTSDRYRHAVVLDVVTRVGALDTVHLADGSYQLLYELDPCTGRLTRVGG